MSLILVTKQGATFGYKVIFTSGDGTEITGLADKLKCEVRSSANELLGTMTITETSTLGTYLFKCPDDTSSWPPCLVTDIKYVNSHGDSIPFDTITIQVKPEVTQ